MQRRACQAHRRIRSSNTRRRGHEEVSNIRPTKEQITELLNAPDEGPVVMLNLLKFKRGGGSSEYGKYGDSVSKMVEKTGGKILWMGRADQTLIGPADET